MNPTSIEVGSILIWKELNLKDKVMAEDVRLKDLRDILLSDYRLRVSMKWVKRYTWKYAYCVPQLGRRTLDDAIEEALHDTHSFAYFVFGLRAEHIESEYLVKY